MKTISIFILLIYWSVILFAPVISKEPKSIKNKGFIKPIEKPSK